MKANAAAILDILEVFNLDNHYIELGNKPTYPQSSAPG